jgi:hypothetical protein
MPTDVRVILAKDFIRATSAGELDLESSKKALEDVASAAAQLVDYVILLDTRRARVQMSVMDLWHLAADLGNLRNTFYRKTAVLCPVERFDDAAFFALCSENRGFRIKAFTSFEDAMNWLIGIAPDA